MRNLLYISLLFAVSLAAQTSVKGNVTTSGSVTVKSQIPSAGATFATICNGTAADMIGGAGSIVRCFNFDGSGTDGTWANATDSSATTAIYPNGGFNALNGSQAPAYEGFRDTSVKADGASSLRFDVPQYTSANTSGGFHMNFKEDKSALFGAEFGAGACTTGVDCSGHEFYIQYRYRLDSTMVNTNFTNSNGFKMSIVTDGDYGSTIQSSCLADHFVMENSNQAGYIQSYHGCSGIKSYETHSIFVPSNGDYFDELGYFPGGTAHACWHYGGRGSPASVQDCRTYVANEWLTVQIHIKVGHWYTGTTLYKDSVMEYWVAREGQPSILVTSINDYDIAQDDTTNNKYGKIWLLPYQTNKLDTQTHPTGHIWYDSMVIATRRIPDPGVTTPNPPDLLRATVVSATQVNLTWRSNSTTEQGFKVERCTGDTRDCWGGYGTWTLVQTLGPGTTSWSDTGRTTNTTYNYRVYAYNASGNSAYSGGPCWNGVPTAGNSCYGTGHTN